jgi:hypothetical protein
LLPAITPSAVVTGVTTVTVVDRAVVGIVEVFWGRRPVVVAVAVIDAGETAGCFRIAQPVVPRERRGRADRARQSAKVDANLDGKAVPR